MEILNKLITTKIVKKMEINTLTGTGQTIKQREEKLFSLGFAKKRFGFAFKDLYINEYQIKYLKAFDWFLYMQYVEEQIINIKNELLQMVSDKEKLQMFSVQLAILTGPELSGQKPREIMESALHVISELKNFIATEAERLPG